MKLIKVTIHTTVQGQEIVSGALLALGHEQLEWIDPPEVVQQFLDETATAWDYTDASALCDRGTGLGLTLCGDEVGREQLVRLREMLETLKGEDYGFDLSPLTIEVEEADDCDWQETWKNAWKPLAVGERWVICPVWEQVPADMAGRRVVRINPGMVFGTGQHESTQLCLELMDELDFAGKKLLDCGTGSGILGLAAALEGADVLGVDIDPNARAVIAENQENCGAEMQIKIGNLLTDEALCAEIGGGWDVVLMNIVADVVLPLLPKAVAWLAAGGVFVTSGITAERQDELAAAMRGAGLEVQKIAKQGEWVGLRGIKR